MIVVFILFCLFKLVKSAFSDVIFVFVYAQDQQLCVFLELQIFSAISVVHVALLPVRCLHVAPLLHRLLAGKTSFVVWCSVQSVDS